MRLDSCTRGDLPSGRGRAAPCRPLLLTGALTAALALGALPIAAQGPWLVEGFAARKEPSTSPLFGGLSISGYTGILGIRLSGALHYGGNEGDDEGTAASRVNREGCRRCEGYSNPWAASSEYALGAWSADADIVLEPFRTTSVLKSLLLGFSPYGFVGIGRYGVNADDAPDTNVATWSYGAGVHHQLIGWLGIGAEARYRRPLHEDTALATSWHRKLEYRAGLTISFGGRGSHAKRGAPPSAAVDEAGSAFASRVLARADGYVDTPYRRGGTSPESGFDAAGFVQYVFGREGVELPRTASAMAEAGERVSTRVGSLRPGDILLFASDGSNVDHVAIYVGRERVIHASASGGTVRYDVLGDGERGQWFADHLVGARRVVGVEPNRPPDEEEPDQPDRAPAPSRPPR